MVNIYAVGICIENEVKLTVPETLKYISIECTWIIGPKRAAICPDVQLAQTLTYMKLGNYKLGLLINFNVALLKNELDEW